MPARPLTILVLLPPPLRLLRLLLSSLEKRRTALSPVSAVNTSVSANSCKLYFFVHIVLCFSVPIFLPNHFIRVFRADILVPRPIRQRTRSIQLELFIFITHFSTVVPLTSCVLFTVGLSLLTRHLQQVLFFLLLAWAVDS